ncbi:MAG: cyclic lactone autoinducer peptide [Dorea sp.]|nr:cyclic lactone autoinducer peptide [Dorea sp.]
MIKVDIIMNRVKINSFAMIFSFVAINSRCVCIFHQPLLMYCCYIYSFGS